MRSQATRSLPAELSKVWMCHLRNQQLLHLSLNVIREVGQYISQLLFVRIHYGCLQILDVTTRISTGRTLSVNFRNCLSYMQVDKGTLICLGNCTTQVFSLDLASAQLKSLSPLRCVRSNPGLAKIASSVYVFAGVHRDSQLCEQYDLKVKTWFDSGCSKHPRFRFTPCSYQTLIYLVSPAVPVETFDPLTRRFNELYVQVPLKESVGSVAFVSNDELYLLTESRQMGCWRVGMEGEFRVTDSRISCGSTQPPLVAGSLVFIANGAYIDTFSVQRHTFL